MLAQIPISLGAFLAPVLWDAAPFDATNPVQIAGAAISVAGILFAVAGLVALGSALTPFPRPAENSRLRQSGVYGWVRHPVYGGHIVASLGWSALWLSWTGLFFTVAAFIFFDRKSAFEEGLLRARFPEYAGYALRVRKLLPCIY